MKPLPIIYISPVNHTIFDALQNFEDFCGLILSKRQHNVYGGYVSKELIEKISKSNFLIERDHFFTPDNQLDFQEIKYDSIFFDMIHIDPWFYKKYDINIFVEVVKEFEKNNKNLKYEIGTEDYIHQSTLRQYSDIIDIFQKNSSNSITYLVSQGGSVVFDLQNISEIDVAKTKEFVELARSCECLVKRHNCDFHTIDQLKQLQDLGVNAFNFAPEFSTIYNREIANILNKKEKEIMLTLIISKTPWDRWLHDCSDAKKLLDSCLHYVDHEIIKEKTQILQNTIVEKLIDKITQLKKILL